MPASALRRTFTVSVATATLALFLLNGCGSSTHVCPLAAGASGCCASSDAACPAPPPHLFAAAIDGHVSSFPVTPGAGTLGSPTSVSGPVASNGLASLGNQSLYASNRDQLSGGGIDAWTIDPSTGALTTIAGSPFLTGVFSVLGGIAVNDSASMLYVADAGKIDQMSILNGGALQSSGSTLAGIGQYLALDPLNRFLFSSDITPPGYVYAFTLDALGNPAAVPGSPFPVTQAFPDNTEPNQIVVDSTGSFVFVALLATNQIAAFSVAPTTGVLNPVPGSPFATGQSPLAVTTINHFLYVSNALDLNVSGYSIDVATGVLSPLASSPFAIVAGSLTTDPQGAFLYASGPEGLQVFSIDATSGALAPVGSPASYPGATVLTYVQ
ncbi:MAG TPA: beta-propeller fold lactonase family protein [Candidatus Solibacter sp.]|nr:beta-propeller fold lactonase family protein [Candidatus Solibacter sp.]